MTASEEDSGLRLQAHHSGWTTWTYAGEPARAREHSEAGRRLYDPEKHASHRHLYGGHDPGVCARSMTGQAGWLLGYPETALTSIADALALAERIAHPFSLSIALLTASVLHLNRREPGQALGHLGAAEALAVEQRLSLIFEPGMLRGAALLAQGATDEAVVRLRQSLTESRKSGRRFFVPYGQALLAEALTRRGEPAAALEAVREGLVLASATGERGWDAVLHRANGLAWLAENKIGESEASLLQALQVARQQQAKSLELRAAISLALIWGEQGRREEARELLAPIYGWFTEGFDTADLVEAKALLDALA
jgi:predicted ATPase